jgi:MFS family permease
LQKHYRQWLAWLIASVFYLYEYTHRVSISVMIPELSLAFQANPTDISSLSASYFYVYAIMQIPAGFIIDKYSTKIILPLSAIVTSMGCLMFAQTNQLLMANLARGLIGLGSAFAFIGCLKIASQQIAASKFAFIVGMTNFLGAIGGFLGGEPYLMLIQEFGWRQVSNFSAYVALVFAFIMWLSINPQYNIPNEHTLKDPQLTLDFSLFNGQIWLIAILASLMICPISTYTQLWGATFLQTQRELNLAQASLLSSVTFFGIAIGGPIICYINNYLNNQKQLLYIGIIGACISLLLILFVDYNNHFYLALIHLLLGVFTSSMLLCFSLSTNHIAPKHHGAVIGIINAIITFIGASFQIIAGKIIENNNEEILMGMLPLIACHILCLILVNKIKYN